MIDVLFLALVLLVIGAFVQIAYELHQVEKETMRLLKQLEAGYFDKEVGK